MTVRESYLNPTRPVRWPGEEDHFRSDIQVGDIVRGEYGNLAEVIGFNNTHSHVTAGRLVYLQGMLAHPGTPEPDNSQYYDHRSSWERDLTAAQPGDVGAHRDNSTGDTGGTHVFASWQG